MMSGKRPLLMIAQVFPRLKQSSGASTIALLNDGHITNNSKVRWLLTHGPRFALNTRIVTGAIHPDPWQRKGGGGGSALGPTLYP